MYDYEKVIDDCIDTSVKRLLYGSFGGAISALALGRE